MGKRENENSQLSKEEYEALDQRGSGSIGSFTKASEEEMGKRRILSARKKWKPKGASTASTGGSNAFAGFSFSKDTAPTPAAPSAKPSFALPTMSVQPSDGTKATTSQPLFGAVKTAQPTPGSKEKQDLLLAFQDHLRRTDLRASWRVPGSCFVNTMFQLESKDPPKPKSNPPLTASASTTSTSNSTSKPQSEAPPAAPFSFTAPQQSSSSPPAPNFSFTPSTTDASSGFSFAPAPVSTTTAPGSNVKFSLSPVQPLSTTTASSETPAEGAGAENQGSQEGDDVLESADDDWKVVYTAKVKVYHYREKKATRFATEPLKLQEHKKDSKNRRMVMRNPAGKVLLNLKIAEGMTFNLTVTPGKGGRPPTSRIDFFGVMTEEQGAEKFTLVCKNVDADSLLENLKTLAK